MENIRHEKRLSLDPSKYRPKEYVLDMEVPINTQEKKATGSLVVDNVPFILDFITHSLPLEKDEDQTALYSFIFRDVDRAYNTDWTLSTLLFGHSYRKCKVLPLTVPLHVPPSSSLIMDVMAHFAYGDAPSFPLKITFHGFERWTP